MTVWDELTSPSRRPGWEGDLRLEESDAGWPARRRHHDDLRGEPTLHRGGDPGVAAVRWLRAAREDRRHRAAHRPNTGWHPVPDGMRTQLHVRWFGPKAAQERAVDQAERLTESGHAPGGVACESVSWRASSASRPTRCVSTRRLAGCRSPAGPRMAIASTTGQISTTCACWLTSAAWTCRSTAAARLASWCHSGHCEETTGALPLQLAARRAEIEERIAGLRELDERLASLQQHLATGQPRCGSASCP